MLKPVNISWTKTKKNVEQIISQYIYYSLSVDNSSSSNIGDSYLLDALDFNSIDKTYVKISQEEQKRRIDFVNYVRFSFNKLTTEERKIIYWTYLDKENNAGAYYFSVKSFRDKSIGDDAKDEDVKFYEELKKEFDIQWVPSVYHIVNGKIISKYEFLSKQYYEIEDEQERDSAEKEFIDNFYKWYGIESQI